MSEKILDRLETEPLSNILRSKVSAGIGKITLGMTENRGRKKVDAMLNKDISETDPNDSARVDQDDAYLSYRDNLVASYVKEKYDQREFRKARRKYILGRIGSAAMWIPGVDVIGDKIQENRDSKRINRQIRSKYHSANGTEFARLRKTYRANKEKHESQKKILKSFKDSLGTENWK